MISYEYYKIFYYACKYKNFTKAAGALGTSQSSVSHIMNTLESQIGCRLFARSNRGIKLTPEGERLYSYVAAGCEQFIKGENELANGATAESGVVYISATETALNCILFKLLNKFRSKYPGVKFKIENLSTYSAADSVKNGTSDYAFVSTPIKIGKGLTERALIEFSDVLICGSSMRELTEQTIDIQRIADYPFISLSVGTATRLYYDSFFEKNKIYIEPDIEVATTDMIIPMVKNNMGIGFVPELMLDDVRDEVYPVKINRTLAKRNVSIIWDKSAPKSPAAKTFLNFILSETL